jgi:hypothetical protein
MTPALARIAFGAEAGAEVRVSADASPLERWLVAVALGGQGRYAAAAAVLQALLADPRVPVTVAAHAAVTLAAHRRQLGGHAVARRLDAHGLRLATSALAAGGDGADSAANPGEGAEFGWDAASARADALTGLAADALGTGGPALARRLLALADDAAAGHPSWRPHVRIGWVRAEAALLAGDPTGAVGPARRSVDLSERAGSIRHVLKSRIVLAVAESLSGGNTGTVLSELDITGDDAERLGLLPLVWPARFAAADIAQRASGQGAAASAGYAETANGALDNTRNIRLRDTTRRRCAASTTLSVIERRCDPVGRLLMGEAGWVPSQRTVI